MHLPWSLLLLSALWSSVSANVEKTIFLGPTSATIPPTDTGLDDLGLERLSPLNSRLRTQLNASFPTDDAPQGTESWYFLENLIPGQRYEVRICYLATQPTSFTLSTFTLPQTMEDPSLLSSISWYSAARLDTVRTDSIPRKAGRRVADSTPLNTAPTSDSVLFLRVQAAADYFSLDQSLMENVPPVAADLVLDPFLLNVFPRSLVPTAGWIVVVAGVAAVVARWITGEFRGLAREGGVIREGKKKK